MEKVLIVLFALTILTSIIVGVIDTIHTHYIKQYIKMLEKEHDIMLENLHVDTKILTAISNKVEVNANEK
jgi:hypothetical protein